VGGRQTALGVPSTSPSRSMTGLVKRSPSFHSGGLAGGFPPMIGVFSSHRSLTNCFYINTGGYGGNGMLRGFGPKNS
jgi:hypothetical protein